MASMSDNKGGSAMPSAMPASSIMSDAKGTAQAQQAAPSPMPTPQATPQPAPAPMMGGFAPQPMQQSPTDLASAFNWGGYQSPQQQTVPLITQPTSPIVPGAPPLDQIQAQTAARMAERTPAPAPVAAAPVKKPEPRRPHWQS